MSRLWRSHALLDDHDVLQALEQATSANRRMSLPAMATQVDKLCGELKESRCTLEFKSIASACKARDEAEAARNVALMVRASCTLRRTTPRRRLFSAYPWYCRLTQTERGVCHKVCGAVGHGMTTCVLCSYPQAARASTVRPFFKAGRRVANLAVEKERT